MPVASYWTPMPLTMDSLRVYQYFLIVSVSLGLLGILAAILRRPNAAQVLGIIAIIAGVMPLLGIGHRIVHHLGLGSLAFALTPIALGGAAVAVANYFKTRPPLKRFQISIPLILYSTLVIASVAGLFKFSHSLYIEDRDGCLAPFLQNPAIENVATVGNNYEGLSRIEAVEFSLAGRPETRVRVHVHPTYYGGDDSFVFNPQPLTILQIGKWTPWETCYATLPIDQGGKFLYSGNRSGFSCESRGPTRELIPLELHSIDDIILHYDELVEMFASWPREAKPGRIELESEQEYEVIEYWVEEVDGAPVP